MPAIETVAEDAVNLAIFSGFEIVTVLVLLPVVKFHSILHEKILIACVSTQKSAAVQALNEFLQL